MPIKPPWFDPPMLVGTTLQGYHLASFVGAGGFGAVYCTADARGEPRAIKVLFPPHSRGNEDMEVWRHRATNFRREALVAVRIQHPNIIQVFDTPRFDWEFHDPLNNQPGHLDLSGSYPLELYVAEYLPDGVDRRLEDGGLFSPHVAIRTGMQICDALGALHSANPRVLHRDLNPGNIRLADGDRVVVTDFGVARIEGLPLAYVDREGPIIHPGVGAPEQFAGEEVDERTDIYQLGALLVVMLTGKYPNRGGCNLLIERKDLPRRLTRAIQQALQPEPARRFQSVADFRNALQVPDTRPLPTRELPPPRQSRLWEFQLRAPNWRTRSTPVSQGAEGCFIWDRQQLHRVEPVTGEIVWSWNPVQEDTRADIRADIRDGPQSPAVQAGDGLLYVRHGSFLSCLRSSYGDRRWEHQCWSDIAGDFLLANGLIILDSHCAQANGLLGTAALNAQTGELVWHLEEPYYYVTSMAASGATLVLVECLGLGGTAGARVRLVELSRGVTLAVHDLFRPGESKSGFSGEYIFGSAEGGTGPVNLKTGITRPRQPLILADGSIVIWSSSGASSGLVAYCFDSQLALRWARIIEGGNDPSGGGASGNNFLVDAGDELFAFWSDDGDDERPQRGWITKIDLETGGAGQTVSIVDNCLPLSGVAGPAGSILFLTTNRKGGDKKSATRWRLMSLKPGTGEILSLEPEGMSYGKLMPLAPIATTSALYLQVPMGTTGRKAQPAGGPPVRASIAAFRRL